MKSAILILLLMVACTPKYYRLPSSASQSEINEAVHRISKTFVDGLSVNACEAAAKDFISVLKAWSIQNSDIKLLKSKRELLTAVFYDKLILKDYSHKLGKGLTDVACLSKVRQLFNELDRFQRVLASHLEASNDTLFMGSVPQLTVNPEYSLDGLTSLESGDILLIQEGVTSESLFNVSVNPGASYGAIALAHKDEGKTYLMFTRMELGSYIITLEQLQKHKPSKVVVLRAKDQGLGAKASLDAFLKIKEYRENNRVSIPYDFDFQYRDGKKFFQGELVYNAYAYASMNKVSIPHRKNNPKVQLLDFYKPLGLSIKPEAIQTKEIFGAQDFLYDPNLDIVGEWYDPQQFEDARLRRIALNRLFEWMEFRKYRVRNYRRVNGSKYVKFLLNDFSSYEGIMSEKSKLQLDSTKRNYLYTLKWVANHLHEKLKAIKDSETISERKLHQYLDSYREKDAKFYPRRKSKFHRYFSS